MKYQVRTNQDGRITIPVGLREELKAKPGDHFAFKVKNENSFIITKVLESDQY